MNSPPPSRTGNVADYRRPSRFEVATASVTGMLPATPLPSRTASPRAALENAIRPALDNGPCYVTFSGGRDSSAVLAVAVALARREGRPLPIPATKVYPDHPDTDESTWQRLVIDHLGLDDWIRVEYHDDLELLGTAARASLRTRGLMWPPALQVHAHWYDHLAPGSVLTGEGGDEVLSARRISALRKLRQRRLPEPAVVALAAGSLLPLPLRTWQSRRQLDARGPSWLTPAANRVWRRRLARDLADTPLRYDEATWHIRRSRGWETYAHNHRLVAAESGITAHDPLLDEGFLAALAHEGGAMGFSGRTATMRVLFADLLPTAVIARATKASFDAPYTGASMREFARGWDGAGVDRELVEPEAIRRAWLADEPGMSSSLLLQHAWMHANGVPLEGDRSA